MRTALRSPRRPSPADALKRLQALPWIGPASAADLVRLGFREPADLKGQDPIALYRRLERITSLRQDPCVLDTFACAIYHAEHPYAKPRPWWEWSRARK